MYLIKKCIVCDVTIMNKGKICSSDECLKITNQQKKELRKKYKKPRRDDGQINKKLENINEKLDSIINKLSLLNNY